MRFVILHVLVQNFPKDHKLGSIQMTLVPRQWNCMDGPVGNILFQCCFVPFQMESTNFGENNSRITIPRPTFKLPSL